MFSCIKCGQHDIVGKCPRCGFEGLIYSDEYEITLEQLDDMKKARSREMIRKRRYENGVEDDN